MIHQIRKRTKLADIAHSLHLYFLGLSLRNTSKAISRFSKSHTAAIREEIGYKSTSRRDCFITARPRYLNFIIDETQLKTGSEIIWLWIATIESETNKNIIATRAYPKNKTCLLLLKISF
jgi:putative transposase